MKKLLFLLLAALTPLMAAERFDCILSSTISTYNDEPDEAEEVHLMALYVDGVLRGRIEAIAKLARNNIETPNRSMHKTTVYARSDIINVAKYETEYLEYYWKRDTGNETDADVYPYARTVLIDEFYIPLTKNELNEVRKKSKGKKCLNLYYNQDFEGRP